MYKLGISAFYHDSAVCLFKDDKIICAAEEERFTGEKHDSSFPINAFYWCLGEESICIDSIKEINWYESPEKKDNRVRTTFAKKPFRTFFLNRKYKKSKKSQHPKNILTALGYTGKINYIDHHYSHAAFSYFSSNFTDAAILTIDGVGEWETTTISSGKQNVIDKKLKIDFPNSLGMLYSTITAYLGFKPNEGEYKVMGLAPYGDSKVYYDKLKKVITNTSNKFWFNQKYFTWEYSDKIMFNKKLCQLLELPPRLPEDTLTQDHKNLAAALQKLYEEQFLLLVKTAKNITGSENLCLGGGCAYNGVANSLAYKYFKSIHVPFAPSDAGSAIGACLNKHTKISPYLGPKFSKKGIIWSINQFKDFIKYDEFEEDRLLNLVSKELYNQKIVAWFQGKMEFGARALGNRSILASPEDPKMREKLNHVIKKREGFRPFAPSVIEKYSQKYFQNLEPIPYMNQVVKAKTDCFPAATHVDGTCRVQTVNKKQNKKYYNLLKEFMNVSGYPVLLNTSFNLKDETITMTPWQAIKRFVYSDIDILVIENFIIRKK